MFPEGNEKIFFFLGNYLQIKIRYSEKDFINIDFISVHKGN